MKLTDDELETAYDSIYLDELGLCSVFRRLKEKRSILYSCKNLNRLENRCNFLYRRCPSNRLVGAYWMGWSFTSKKQERRFNALLLAIESWNEF